MSLRQTFTWKYSADALAACARHLAAAAAPGSETEGEYKRWEHRFAGCAGAEYKLDAEDMDYFGLPPKTPHELRMWMQELDK